MKINYKLLSSKNYPIYFFIFFIFIGSLIYRDYGISVDEPQQREIGKTSLNYIAHLFKIPEFIDPQNRHIKAEDVFQGQKDRDYGVAFELPVEFLVKILGIQDEKIYYFRHYINFILFGICLIFFYKILFFRYQDSSIALLGTLFLIVSPRIFGDAFHNTKDLAFLSFVVIASYTLIRYIFQPNTLNCIWHSIATACAVDLRIMGIILIGLTTAGLILQLNAKSKNLSLIFTKLISYLTLTCIFVFIFWPWLWIDPFGHFLEAFQNMSKFRTNLNMLFFGEITWSGNLPWFYIPTWITITTPLLYLPLFFTGIFSIAVTNKKTIFDEKLQDYLFLILFLGPIILVIALNSVLYNGWRHLYFIYPSFIYLSVRGYYFILSMKLKILLNILRGIVIFSLTTSIYWMIKDHPYQYLYFNALPKDWVRQFDVDYWGVAYKNSLQKIVDKSFAGKVAVFSNVYYDDKGNTLGEFPGSNTTVWQRTPFESALMLSKIDQGKLILHRTEECSDYIFLIIKSHKYPEYLKKNEFEIFDTVQSGGKSVYVIFKRKVPLEGGLLNVKINQSIVFSDPNTNCFLSKGWDNNHESWGIWSSSNQARILLPIPEGAMGLGMDIRGFVSLPMQEQVIEIAGPDIPLQRYKINKFDSNIIQIKLPFPASKNDVLRMDITIPNARSPKQLGLSEDTRLLGIGLKSITFF